MVKMEYKAECGDIFLCDSDRIGDWYQGICTFGVKTRSEITTKIIDEYCQNHPEEWGIVYQNE